MTRERAGTPLRPLGESSLQNERFSYLQESVFFIVFLIVTVTVIKCISYLSSSHCVLDTRGLRLGLTPRMTVVPPGRREGESVPLGQGPGELASPGATALCLLVTARLPRKSASAWLLLPSLPRTRATLGPSVTARLLLWRTFVPAFPHLSALVARRSRVAPGTPDSVKPLSSLASCSSGNFCALFFLHRLLSLKCWV